ncbi:MAG: dTDP-4-dehydrorhamnose reductase [bacterium]|nr:dTDP-4-dehydrorhamnose reductase [bacterium]
MRTVLLTGARGMLAQEVMAQRPGSVHVIETDVEELDITNAAAVEAFCERHAPDAVINCAAYTAVDEAERERERAFAINAAGPRNLAVVCAARGVPFMHVSTDFVFQGDGTHLLREDDPPAPRGVYAESKRAGELYIEAIGGAWMVVRTSWLYAAHHENFVRTILRVAAARGELQVVNDQRGSPTYAADLAEAVWRLLGCGARGYVHFCNRGVCSWYEFAVEIVRLAQGYGVLPADREITITPCATEEFPRPAPRPRFSAMDTRRYTELTGAVVRSWQEALDTCIATLAAQRG